MAEIELPLGVTLCCPVFVGGPISPCVDTSQPDHVNWSKALYGNDFDDEILAQIRELHPGAFEENRSPPRIAPKARPFDE